MAAIGSEMKNFVEWSQHYHKGKVLPEVKLLAQENMAIMDAPMRPCSEGSTHVFRMQTALPTVYKTAFGEGTPESKSQGALERETCTMLTGFSTVEREMSKVGGGQGQIRAQEDANFAEALKQMASQMLCYGNRSSDLKDINGFMTRYNSLTGTMAKNVISCGGTSANAQTSAIMVNWGPDAYLVFPEGTTGGYQKEDLGKQVKTLSNGNQLVVLQTQHLWHFGLVIEAWPSVVRLCNIEVADALALTGTQAPTSASNFLHKIIQARMRIRRPGTKVLYVNDTLYSLMMRLALEKSNAALSVQKAITQFGEFEELTYLGMRVRRNDQILNTEAVVA